MSDKFMTKHPEPGKQGVNIDREKYDLIRDAILEFLAGEEKGFWDMVRALEDRLSSRFSGSVPWYVTTVKLDLEARGQIERVPGSKPQMLRRVGSRERE